MKGKDYCCGYDALLECVRIGIWRGWKKAQKYQSISKPKPNAVRLAIYEEVFWEIGRRFNFKGRELTLKRVKQRD